MTDSQINDLIFEVTEEGDGGFVAECLTESIVTQADSWEELRENAKDAVRGYFFDSALPRHIHLRFRRDEVIKLS
jgi:predicted RNase H-like HicB family nuclease